jgi:Ca2+-transporting ATPase
LRTGRHHLTGNPWLTAAVTGDAALVLAALYLQPLRELLGTQTLTLVDLGAVALTSLAGAVAVVVQRWATRRA